MGRWFLSIVLERANNGDNLVCIHIGMKVEVVGDVIMNSALWLFFLIGTTWTADLFRADGTGNWHGSSGRGNNWQRTNRNGGISNGSWLDQLSSVELTTGKQMTRINEERHTSAWRHGLFLDGICFFLLLFFSDTRLRIRSGRIRSHKN